jgi:hypothetical protein
MTFAYTPGLLGCFFVEESMTFASIPGFAVHRYIMSVIWLVIYNTFCSTVHSLTFDWNWTIIN